MHTASLERPNAAERAFIDQVIISRTGHPGALLGILESVQERHPNKYLPLETLEYIAAQTNTPLSRIYSVVTFYALFNLQPQGDNTICICRGTACHTRGSRNLLQSVRLELGWGWRTRAKPARRTKPCSRLPTTSSRFAPWPASGSVPWRR